MLYEFRAKNFKSFRDEVIFSMKPAPKQKGLDYSVLKKCVGTKQTKALCSAVIYGANASGKTNLISAMDAFKSIVLAGSIRNGNGPVGSNPAANLLELIPNCNADKREPVSFAIEFYNEGEVFSYSLAINLGYFLERDFDREIQTEELKVNGAVIFKREKNHVTLENLSKVKTYLPKGFKAKNKFSLELMNRSLQKEELFLTNGFKSIVSPELCAKVLSWFKEKFLIFCHAEAMTVAPAIEKERSAPLPLEPHFREALYDFGVKGHNLCYVAKPDGTGAELCSFLKDPAKKGEAGLINAKVFESCGTIRFAQLFPLIRNALTEGSVLVIDEFDASIHPMALLSIVNSFHNDEINKNGAQLIFNTHNPIFLNSNYYRRDEIKFVEVDKDTQGSVHYSLSDFGTSGEDGVRKGEDYLTNYLAGRYGAVPEVNFDEIFKAFANSRSMTFEEVLAREGPEMRKRVKAETKRLLAEYQKRKRAKSAARKKTKKKKNAPSVK